jgi:hypothetical protein
VIFHQGLAGHLDCYVGTQDVATVVHNYLTARPHEQFCNTCLAQHVSRERREVEKAATALRVSGGVVVEAAICSACGEGRLTIQAKADSL